METVKFKTWFQKMGSHMRAMSRDISSTERTLLELRDVIAGLKTDLRQKTKIYQESIEVLKQLKKEQQTEERILKNKLRGYIRDNVQDASKLIQEFEKADF